MKIGERIRQRRKEIGLSVDELAEILGKNRATVYRYESNEIEKLPTTVLEPLAKALKTTLAYLMGWEDESAELEIQTGNKSEVQLDHSYLSFAKEAQDEGIDPDDIRLAIETIKAMRNKK